MNIVDAELDEVVSLLDGEVVGHLVMIGNVVGVGAQLPQEAVKASADVHVDIVWDRRVDIRSEG